MRFMIDRLGWLKNVGIVKHTMRLFSHFGGNLYHESTMKVNSIAFSGELGIPTNRVAIRSSAKFYYRRVSQGKVSLKGY